jgi:hypothetical protein
MKKGQISLRVTEELKCKIDNLVKDRNLSISEYIIGLIESEMGGSSYVAKNGNLSEAVIKLYSLVNDITAYDPQVGQEILKYLDEIYKVMLSNNYSNHKDGGCYA